MEFTIDSLRFVIIDKMPRVIAQVTRGRINYTCEVAFTLEIYNGKFEHVYSNYVTHDNRQVWPSGFNDVVHYLVKELERKILNDLNDQSNKAELKNE